MVSPVVEAATERNDSVLIINRDGNEVGRIDTRDGWEYKIISQNFQDSSEPMPEIAHQTITIIAHRNFTAKPKPES